MSKILQIGSTGEEVRHWKEYLSSQGFQIDTSSDRFDPATLAATRQMQRRLGVKADGKVGHRTLGRQAATQDTPLPQARPDMPPAPLPRPGGLQDASSTGDTPFVSSGPEADLASMRAGASNNRARDQMAQELMGQYYDTRQADAMQGQPPAMPFTDQGAQTMNAGVEEAIRRKQGFFPPSTFDVAAPPSSPDPSMDFSGYGQPQSPIGAPAPMSMDPRMRDQVIRLLLQNAGG